MSLHTYYAKHKATAAEPFFLLYNYLGWQMTRRQPLKPKRLSPQ